MDEKIEKAFVVANYMSTLSNQKRIILEEYNQKLIYYFNGATFKITPTLINFAKTLIDQEFSQDAVLIDDNNFPVIIPDLKKFLDEIIFAYFEATNEYAKKYNDIRTKRKILDIVDL